MRAIIAATEMGKSYLKTIFYVSLAVNIILVAILSVFVLRNTKKTSADVRSNYPLLSPRIFAENQNDLIINFVPLRKAVQSYTDQQNGNVGVYFEYLPTGTSIIANSDMRVKIASLVKIPSVMAIYKAIEEGRLSLDKTLTVKKENLDNGYGDLWKAGEGKKLMVQEAIDLTLKQSDNTAHNVLRAQLNDQDVTNVLNSLDIPLEEQDSHFTISPKNYTSILRSLYLSSYLSKSDSNSILDTLTQTDFSDKLPAGVGQNIKVAHKIGVFDHQGADSSQSVYSDCGIIYIPNRPYSLCVMVKNNDNAQATEIIKHISDMVYKYMQVAS
jgi:beta-lactamase class A